MGRGRGRGRGQKRTRGGDRNTGAEASAPDNNNNSYEDAWGNKHWVAIPKENKAFEEYYKLQKIVPEGEWDQFMAAIRRDLPSSFRINCTDKVLAEIIRNKIEEFCKEMETLEVDGQKIDAPSPIEWYPDRMGWQTTIPRAVLRKNPVLKKFHKWLQMETAMGNISRQETVSMIPPFFLQPIEPHHFILDMCASPGSKTAQLLEFLAEKATNENPITGFVLANDVDWDRCNMLVHQLQRLNDLFPYVMVSNEDATRFPSLSIPEKGKENVENPKMEKVKFDRILCDVVCSGDGTVRKAPDMWKRWNPMLGVDLHRTQLDIAIRAFHLLKDGGRLVYSTCSLNPIEDEAVVAEILRRTKGALRLVDTSNDYPNLKRQPGLTTWIAMDKQGNVFKTLAETEGKTKSTKFVASMFPPTPEEAAEMHLERCMRLLPHSQDTGGFFVAVFEKVPIQKQPKQPKPQQQEQTVEAQTATEGSSASPTDNATTNNNEGAEEGDKKEGKKLRPLRSDEEFCPLHPDIVQSLKTTYGFDENFPWNQLLAKNATEDARKIYFVAENVRRVLEANIKSRRWKIANAGVLVFMGKPNTENPKDPQQFRISQDGVNIIYPYMRKRVLKFKLEDFLALLKDNTTPFKGKSESEYLLSAECRKQLLAIREVGGCVVVLDNKEYRRDPRQRDIIVSAWLAPTSINRLVKKIDLESYLYRISVQDPRFNFDPVAAEEAKEKEKAKNAAAAAAPANKSENDDKEGGEDAGAADADSAVDSSSSEISDPSTTKQPRVESATPMEEQ